MKRKPTTVPLAGFALALALLGGVAWLAWRQTVRMQETATWVAYTHRMDADRNWLIAVVLDVELAQRGYVLTGQSVFLDLFEQAVNRVARQERRMEELIRDAEQQTNLSALKPLIVAQIDFARRTVELRQKSGADAARREFATLAGKNLTDQIRERFALMGARSKVLLNERSAAAEQEANDIRRVMATGVSLGFVLLVAVFAQMLRENRLRRRAEEQMAGNLKTLADFKAALDEHALVAITDARGKITYVNDKFCTISKYAREELMGQDHRIINSGHHPKAFIRELWETITNGRVWKGQIKNRAKDGTIYWVDTSIVPFLDEHGKPAQYIAIRADITERKQAEEQIVQLNAELQQHAAKTEAANKELEAFSYSVSHDLRAPLRHIHGYVEMLTAATGGQLADKPRRYLQTIVAASAAMGQLIDDLLAFSRTGRVELRRECVRLDELVAEVIRGLDMAVKGRAIEWRIAPLPAVNGDAALLRQVLANLVGNAVKYSRGRDPTRIEIGLAGEEAGRAIIFVRDNGAGFDMQYASKLFGVFQRLHREEEFEGTGIGLATVQRIVARHGGRVWAEGKLGEGAAFFFTLQPEVSPTNENPEISRG